MMQGDIPSGFGSSNFNHTYWRISRTEFDNLPHLHLEFLKNIYLDVIRYGTMVNSTRIITTTAKHLLAIASYKPSFWNSAILAQEILENVKRLNVQHISFHFYLCKTVKMQRIMCDSGYSAAGINFQQNVSIISIFNPLLTLFFHNIVINRLCYRIWEILLGT